MQLGELLVKLGADFSQINKDLAKAEGMAHKSGTRIGDIFGQAVSVTLGMGLFDAVKTGFKTAASTAFDFNAQLQAANMGFRQMLGSVGATTKFMAELTAFSAKTPFEFPGLLESSRQMMAMQWQTERIIPDLKTIGDALAGIGKFGPESVQGVVWALGKMKMYGRVSAREMMMLVNQGIPAWQILADEMGKTTAEVRELSEKGLIPAQTAINALLKGMDKRFGGMMKNLENSWYGVTSTIKDVFRLTIGAMSENLFKGVNKWLVGVKDFAQRFYDALKAGGLQNAIHEVFGAGAANAFALFSAAIKGAWNIVSGFFNMIRSNWNIFAPLIKGALLLYTSFRLTTFAVNAAKKAMETFVLVQKALAGESLITSGILGLVSKAMGIYRVQMRLAAMEGIVLTGVLAKVQVALYSVWTALGPIGWVILAIAGALGIGVALWGRYTNAMKAVKGASPADLAKGFRDVEKSSQAAADGIGEQTDAMKDAKKAAKDNLTAFDEINKLQADMGDAATLDTPTLDEMIMPEMPDMGGILADIEAELPPFGERVKGFFGWLWDGIKAGAVTAWNATTGAIKTIWTGFVNLTRPIWQPVAEFFSGLWSIIADDSLTWWEKIKGVLLYTWKSIVNVTRPIWEPIGRFFSWLWDGIKTVTVAVWDFIKPYLEMVWNGIATIANVIWNGIRTFLETTWSGISTAGQAIWNGFAWFFTSLWNGLNTFIRTIWTGISQFLSTVWNGIKNTAVTIWNSIKTAITGPMETARNILNTIWNGIKTNILSAWSAIRQGISNTSRLLYNSILNPFDMAKRSIDNIIRDAYNWGKNMMSNIVDGIKSKISAVKNAVSNVASTIKGYIGFSSPTKEGPGRYADEWAPNLIKMYADGIIRNTGLVESAAGGVAGSLSAMNGATVNGGFNAETGNSDGNMTIIVKIGDDTITEKVISNINRKSRISGETVITV